MAFDPITAVSDLISTTLNKFIPDADARVKADLALQLQVLVQQAAMDAAQAATNTAEASSSDSWIKSNWRPLMGMVCVCSFAWTYCAQPVFDWILILCGHAPINAPPINMDAMEPILIGMLGLAGARTYERVRGVIK